MTNNFQKSLPIIIDPRLISIFRAERKKGNKKYEPLDHSPRPYRVLVSDDNLLITEWMMFPDGSVDRTPWGVLKKDYLLKNKTKDFFLAGIKGRYHLLKTGQFLVPKFPKPITIRVNDIDQIFDDIYPNLHFLIKSRTSGSGHGFNEGVGISWRKTLPITDDWNVDFTVTLLISWNEYNFGWEIIASDPSNEKYKYETSLTFIPQENLLDVKVNRREVK